MTTHATYYWPTQLHPDTHKGEGRVSFSFFFSFVAGETGVVSDVLEQVLEGLRLFRTAAVTLKDRPLSGEDVTSGQFLFIACWFALQAELKD